jgi:hypothetical protein
MDAKTGMGNPIYKASNGGFLEFYGKRGISPKVEFRRGNEMKALIRKKVCPCLCRSGFAQAGRSRSERPAHARMIRIYATSGLSCINSLGARHR